tara:strand:+ start:2069 stop:2329 length:261 start_codon:yes stop_codon:yes gene_type:complete
MYLEISFGIVLFLFVIACYVIWNLMRKTELLETWVEGFSQMLQTVQQELSDIDSKGSFESDDETGTIYKQIKDTINQLESYKGEEQ